jgi:hypothetical protein
MKKAKGKRGDGIDAVTVLDMIRGLDCGSPSIYLLQKKKEKRNK